MAGLRELTSTSAVEQAIAECDELGENAFLERYGFGPARDYFLVRDGKSYPSKAIAGVAYGKQFPERGHLTRYEFSGGEHDGNAAHRLRELGFEVEGPSPGVLDAGSELERRTAMWEAIVREPDPARMLPSRLRDLGVYGGAQGIWVDKAHTGSISRAPEGVTVGLRHTGRHYDDDLAEDCMIYHYPSTGRGPNRDEAEIEATKNAHRLELPVFVIAPGPTATTRTVHRAWVDAWDDQLRQFLVTFDHGQNAPEPIPEPEDVDALPFELTGDESPVALRVQRSRPNQQRFRFAVSKYYGPGCSVCTVNADGLIDAAHLCPKSERGADDPRNGLPLCATHHRALDRELFGIDPDDLSLHPKPSGPTLAELGITVTNLSHLPRRPHHDALEHVWRRFARTST